MKDETLSKLEKSYQFPGQREGEEVKFILRRHKITLLTALLYFCLLALLPLIFYTLLAPYAFPILINSPYKDIYFMIATIYYGFLWIVAFMEWVDYYLDIWIVTNERILDIEQRGLFHRIVSEVDLKRVQDITSTVDGPIQTFFKFGNIQIQTASEENIVRPKLIPHPVTVRREIMDLCKQAQEKNRWVFKEEE